MNRKRGVLTFILMTVLSGIGAAQTAPLDLVYVAATVTGPKKAPAPGLTVENFQLLEDGVEQKLTFFSAADGPWNFNILLANSLLKPGRADRISTEIRDAVDTFQKTNNPATKVTIEELKFGSDAMYAAIDRHLVDLQRVTNPRKALIVVTDGFDMPGGDASNALVEYSRQLNIPIYFLYTKTNDSDLGARGTGTRGTNYSATEGEALTNVAEQTGGHIYFVDPEHQLEAQFKLLAEEFRSKYVVGFKSTNDKKDNKWRKLKVTVKPPSGTKLDIETKGKYFVPKPLSK